MKTSQVVAILASSAALVSASTVANGKTAVQRDAPSGSLLGRWGNLAVNMAGVDPKKAQSALKASDARIQSNNANINGLMGDTLNYAGSAASGVNVNNYVNSGISSLKNYVAAADWNSAAKNVLSYTSTLASNSSSPSKRSIADSVHAIFGRAAISDFNQVLNAMVQNNDLNQVAQRAAAAAESQAQGIDWNQKFGSAVSDSVKSLGGVNWAGYLSSAVNTMANSIS